ncbi:MULTISPECIES: succinylglutamate desuccinylase/aspartoacylase family protein [unclassified Haladaptatus]|uniref:succinylglutamate desuccinylase/aspartoacylase domain-containing protein n=1 Tax=unclassified Haladaptatus TaxID=2622732 RepID=UPI0023E84E48|nr:MULTISPECIES: succinylglutamate desuccinylase/aspartoacylase family protein [unclassified Haladaptatus]
MRVEQIGEGDPAIAVVAAIHGDEPCGVRAVERLLEERPQVRRPVKLIVANEEALAEGVRFLDEDLNRTFPGDPDGDTHESRLAAELIEELDSCLTLALHSTKSHAEPFAIFDDMTEYVRDIMPRLPIAAVVETGDYVEGRLFTSIDTIEVECGLQGTRDAAENADRLTRAFLTATGVLPGDAPEKPVPHFRLQDKIPKGPADQYEVFVENFKPVEKGKAFAAADGKTEVAEEPFYPVLLSATGYRNVFGYTADYLGELSFDI